MNRAECFGRPLALVPTHTRVLHNKCYPSEVSAKTPTYKVIAQTPPGRARRPKASSASPTSIKAVPASLASQKARASPNSGPGSLDLFAAPAKDAEGAPAPVEVKSDKVAVGRSWSWGRRRSKRRPNGKAPITGVSSGEDAAGADGEVVGTPSKSSPAERRKSDRTATRGDGRRRQSEKRRLEPNASADRWRLFLLTHVCYTASLQVWMQSTFGLWNFKTYKYRLTENEGG